MNDTEVGEHVDQAEYLDAGVDQYVPQLTIYTADELKFYMV